MRTAVDTSVLLDVLGGATPFAESSREALKAAYAEGTLLACEVVWAETRAHFPSHEFFLDSMKILHIQFQEITSVAAALAGELWQLYRKRGGARQRVLADFLVGAHALTSSHQLLARDRGFYRTYFTKLKLIDPSRG